MGIVNQFNILVIGGGGREHALAWALAKSPLARRIWIIPGNAGTNWDGAPGRAPCESVRAPAEGHQAIIHFAQGHAVDLVLIGPEQPLAEGLSDALRKAGFRVFGPSQAAAQVESSKAFAKDFMRRHHIPTAPFEVFTEVEPAEAFIQRLNRPCVVKADGLAAGKGVYVCDSPVEAEAAVRAMLSEKVFGEAGQRVIIEERLSGREVSVLAFSDGTRVALMPPARDHKRALDGDQGLNTGGMGAFTPVPDFTLEQLEWTLHKVIQPAIDGLRMEGTPFVGVLYAGLMLTSEGIRVLEFNCRFGDPETQVILPLLDSDLIEVCLACAEGRLDPAQVRWRGEACAAVVVASGGYPEKYPTGLVITGLEDHTTHEAFVFQAGTELKSGQTFTAGGRVLAVSGRAHSLSEALERAYRRLETIHFEGMHYRRDIGRSTRLEEESAYARAGVNIDSGNRAVKLMASAVKATYTPAVLAGIGAFGGLFSGAALKGMNDPVLVASTDGVGTKTKVAARLNQWDSIGRDLVNHCLNDILVQGALPLFFLDYVASAALDPEQIAQIVGGVAAACQRAGCALLGGETAEMPGVYEPGAVDIVGTIVGVVERSTIIDGRRIQPGDAVIGMFSSGLHTNGYSLARRALEGLDWEQPHPSLLGQTVGAALLAVHRSYLPQVKALLAAGIDVRGLAHITGGGLIENPPRIFPSGVGMRIQRDSWEVPPLFRLIQKQGKVADREMYRVFNMGIGMIAVVPTVQSSQALAVLGSEGVRIGEMIMGAGEVHLE